MRASTAERLRLPLEPEWAKPRPEWAPALYTPRRFRDDDADDIADYAEELLTVRTGFRSGRALELTDWQFWLMQGLFERRPDGLLRRRRSVVGVARKNGKSLKCSTIGLFRLTEADEETQVLVGAGDKKQARIIFGEAKNQVHDSPELSTICKPYKDAIEVRSGPARRSVFRVLSADAALQQGLNGGTVLVDELHVQPNHDLWDALCLSQGALRDPCAIGITTAGARPSNEDEDDDLLWFLYKLGMRAVSGELDDESFGFWWWAAPDGCSVMDPAAWRAANPNLAEGLMSWEDMATAAKQTGEIAFRRYRLNQWVLTAECWLGDPSMWARCEDRTHVFHPEDGPFWLAVDFALRDDHAFVVAAQPFGDAVEDRWEDEQGVAHAQAVAHLKVEGWDFDPAGTVVSHEDVEALVRRLYRSGNLKGVAYDPARFQRSAQVLLDEGVPMVEMPQTHARMVPACATAYRAVANGRVRQRAQAELSDHVLSAAAHAAGEGWRLTKAKSKRKIDGAVALVMAIDLALALHESEGSVYDDREPEVF